MILPNKACKHEISRTTHLIYVICGAQVTHDLKVCPVLFGNDVMNINEWVGLNVKNCLFCFIFGIVMLLVSIHVFIISKCWISLICIVGGA